jgi:HlyD family secretion protein
MSRKEDIILENPKVVKKKKQKKWILWLALIAAGVGTYYYFAPSKKAETAAKIVTMPLSYGDISQVVTATGEISPVNSINIGSQVSGIIEKIYVDYNDIVQKDQVLLTIDPQTLQASVNEAEAKLKRAESQRNYSKAEYERNRELYKSGYIAKSEMDQSKTNYESLVQDYNSAKSGYDRAVVNLGYATIKSPVAGTVISRKVDEGQTVAASLQSPDLFVIAEDLTKMHIETSISEADIGAIKSGQTVSFTVDAYPAKTVDGVIKQVRLSPTTTQNVVVYTVIIDVDNTNLELMPGMTAFVTITVAEVSDTWKCANSALLKKDLNAIAAVQDLKLSKDATYRNTILVLRGDKMIAIPFEKGLVTSTETEIKAEGLQEGDKIVTGLTGMSSAVSGGNRGGMPGMGGPRR